MTSKDKLNTAHTLAVCIMVAKSEALILINCSLHKLFCLPAYQITYPETINRREFNAR